MKPQTFPFFIFLLFFLFSNTKSFILTSKDISNNEKIPLKFTPFSDDINPSFEWSDAPQGTKSFAFTVEDPDCPTGLFYHWVLINIPKSVNKINQKSFPGKAVKNSWGIAKYKGPKPPSGTHHYHFIVYALDVETLPIRSYEDFKSAIEGHILGKAEIVGLFTHIDK